MTPSLPYLPLGTPRLTSWLPPCSQTPTYSCNPKAPSRNWCQQTKNTPFMIRFQFVPYTFCLLGILLSFERSQPVYCQVQMKNSKCCFSETDDALWRVLPSFVAPSDKLSSIWTLKRAHQRKVSEFKIHVVHTFAFQVST